MLGQQHFWAPLWGAAGAPRVPCWEGSAQPRWRLRATEHRCCREPAVSQDQLDATAQTEIAKCDKLKE